METPPPQPAEALPPAVPASAVNGPPVFRPEYLTFQLGGAPFALPIKGIREVVGCLPITEVPGMPLFLRGVMNLRGVVMPVIDLRVRLGLAPARATRRSCIVIVELEDGGLAVPVGLLVDAVQAVLGADDAVEELPQPEGGSLPETGAVLPPGFVDCELLLDGRRTTLLHTGRALSIEELKEGMLQ